MVTTIKNLKDNRRYLLKKALPYLFVLGLLIVCVMSMFVFAGNASNLTQNGAKEAIATVIKIIMVLMSALGALFIVLGVIKFTIAHAQEDSPSQQKAAMLIASGIALFIVGFVISQINFGNLIVTKPSVSVTGWSGK